VTNAAQTQAAVERVELERQNAAFVQAEPVTS